MGTPEIVDALNSGLNDQPGGLAVSGSIMILSSTSDNPDYDFDLFTTARSSDTSPFAMPQRVEELVTPVDDTGPTLSPDGLVIVFDSKRNGVGPVLFYATRPDLGSSFDEARPIAELNTPGIEADPWISPDLKHLYCASDREGSSRIYEASR